MPTLLLETPEGIALKREIVGAGSRFSAALIDVALLALVFLSVLFASLFAASVDPTGLSDFAVAFVAGGFLLVYVIYFAAFHQLWNGQTPGKRLLHLRVTAADGYPASFTQHLLRAIFAPLESFLFVPLPLGLMVMAASPVRQRLGDAVAGTVVLKERASTTSPDPWPQESWSGLAQRTLKLDPGLAARLSSEDFEYLRDLITRQGLEPQERRKLLVRAARHYAQRLDLGTFDDARVVLKELFLFARESRQH